jgi:hypothetical protein
MTTLRLLLGVLLVLLCAPELGHAKKRPPAGPITFYTVERPTDALGAGTISSISVSCAEGDEVLGGGYAHTTDQRDLQVSASFPDLAPSSAERTWIFQIQNFSETLSYQITLYARCAHVN